LRDSLGLNDVEREKLNELINFFITCRIDPVRHGGEFSSQYKREFPSLINMIRKKSIDRNTFNIRIANLENLKKETEEDIRISREERHEKRMKSYEAKKMINEIISLLQILSSNSENFLSAFGINCKFLV
jgi:hypothetical protein